MMVNLKMIRQMEKVLSKVQILKDDGTLFTGEYVNGKQHGKG